MAAQRPIQEIPADELLQSIAEEHFGVSPEAFLRGVLYSANARGYILGALSELLLSEHLLALGYEVQRIKEKWVGEKHHHGDFYVRREGDEEWFILESKGLKSNSEGWRKIALVDSSEDGLEQFFRRKRRGEMKRWWDSLSAERRRRILTCGGFANSRVLETHFVSGTAGRSGRTIATPRKDEFHVVALDLFLRTGRHEWAFAATDDLPGSPSHPDHLQQNYIVDIVVPGADEEPVIVHPWSRDFDTVFDRLTNPIDPSQMQVDERQPGEREAEVLRRGRAALEEADADGDGDSGEAG